uniref:Transmembrane protein 50B n=1 Tax=Rhinopithecus bieti TaxID=61621 RepID=A0A2K6KKS5_RHIBE
MAGFLDNFRWPECECIDWSERTNAVASVVAGILFFYWWIMIDAAVVYSKPEQLNHAFHTCGVFSTLAFFMINAQVRGDSYESGCLGRTGARVWFFHWFHVDVLVTYCFHVDSFWCRCYPNTLIYTFGRTEELWT